MVEQSVEQFTSPHLHNSAIHHFQLASLLLGFWLQSHILLDDFTLSSAFIWFIVFHCLLGYVLLMSLLFIIIT